MATQSIIGRMATGVRIFLPRESLSVFTRLRQVYIYEQSGELGNAVASNTARCTTRCAVWCRSRHTHTQLHSELRALVLPQEGIGNRCFYLRRGTGNGVGVSQSECLLHLPNFNVLKEVWFKITHVNKNE